MDGSLLILLLLAASIAKVSSQQDSYCYQPVDVGILLDSSTNFGAQNFEQLKTFAKKFISNFELSSSGLDPYIAIVPYSDRVIRNRVINFRYSTSTARLTDKIDRLRFYGRRRSRMDTALRMARNSLFRRSMGSRRWVPRVVLAITGSMGSWNRYTKLAVKRDIQNLRSWGVHVLMASIGPIDQADGQYLESMLASKRDLFLVSYTYELLQVAGQMVKQLCPAPSTFACPGKVDIAFVVDSSGSISNTDYSKMKYFMYSIANALKVSETGARAGVVIYSKYAEVAIKFSDHKDIMSFRKAVYKLKHMKSYTRIDLGLSVAYTQLFSTTYGGARPGVKKMAIILTDGKQSEIRGRKISLRESARPLIDSGIKTLSVGIGSSIDTKELRAMVEKDKDVITATNFDELLNRIENITEQACGEIGPAVCERDVDLAFILDSSGSISMDEFDEARSFVENLSKTFNISPGKTHAALMIYSDEARIMSKFGNIRSQNDLRAQLDTLPHLRGKTRIDLALRLAGAELFTGQGGMRVSNPALKMVAIVITDGRQSPAADAMRLDEAVAPLLVRGVKVLSIGVGDRIDRQELNMMVADPERHAFWAKTYQALGAQLASIARESCS